MAVKNQWYLECTRGTSNKFYLIKLTRSEGRTHRFTVETEYGPIGANPRKGKSKVFYSRMEAIAYVRKVVAEKTGKGYRELDDKTKKTEKKPKKKKLNKPTDASLNRFSSLLME